LKELRGEGGWLLRAVIPTSARGFAGRLSVLVTAAILLF
jgi:hypothetical protein